MNVYDFDNTIYDGESTFDFFAFCLRRDITLLKFMFPVVKTLIQYKMCRISLERLKELCEKYMAEFLLHIDDHKKLIAEFWDRNQHKIKDFYKKQKREDDVVISASCDILLKEICQRLSIKNLIASEIDFKNLKVKNLCYGENKVSIFYEKFPGAVIDEFYSDSKNDLPMAKLAKKAYYVKKNKIGDWI